MPSTPIEEPIATTIQQSLRHWEEEAREAELYTEAEAAKSLKMSQRNLQELRRTGQIEWTQGAGRRVLYTRKQITDFVRSKARRTTS